MTSLVWTPAVGSALTFQGGLLTAGLRLLDVRGLEPVPIDPFTVKGPRQPGTTLADVIVGARTVEVEALIQEATQAALWTSRRAVASSLAYQPARLLDSISAGLVTFNRDGEDALQIAAVPRAVDFERGRGSIAVHALSVDFYCPQPYWAATSESSQAYAAGDSVVINNPGDVDCAIRVVTTGGDFEIRNLTTGETIAVDGAGGATTVTTGFADKQITVGGVSALDHLDVAASDMWQLRPGNNSVQITGSAATLYWRPLYSGV